MIEFLKRFGLGILYVVLSPIFLLILALFTIYGLGLFLFMAVKACILFFTGRSVFDDMLEDTEAKRRLGTLVDEPLNRPFRVKKGAAKDVKKEVKEEPKKEPKEEPKEDKPELKPEPKAEAEPEHKLAKPEPPKKDGDVK
ncbi:MAG: hypothetical protein NTV44_04620 [Firmicutes bacterium]|nr:hypothetical protein [Bacillota bacterium]